MEDSVRILHKPNRRFCYFQEKRYICIELFDEMQSAAVQRSYTVAKSLLTTFLISTLRCHSDRYIKVSYPMQRKERKNDIPGNLNYWRMAYSKKIRGRIRISKTYFRALL